MNSKFDRRGFTLRELFIVMTVLAILFAVFMAVVVNPALSAANKNHCRSFLKQLGLACQTYKEAYKAFPRVCYLYNLDGSFHDVSDPTTTPQFSWRVSMLPYIEERDLYSQLSQATKNFSTDPLSQNIKVDYEQQIRSSPQNVYCYPGSCPANTTSKLGNSNYVALSATKQQLITVVSEIDTLADGVIIPKKVNTIKDGESRTFLITESLELERSNWYHWQQTFVCGFLPGDTSVSDNDPTTGVPRCDENKNWIFNKTAGDRTALNFGPTSTHANRFYNNNASDPFRRNWGASSLHPGSIVNHGMAEGSVRDIKDDIDPKIYYALITRDGGEKIIEDDF